MSINSNKGLLKLAEYGLAGVLVVWLLVAAATVNVEYYDGMDAVLNINSLFGNAVYIPNRAPMMSVLLFPGKYLVGNSIPAYDFRPYHLSMAIIHIIYLAVVYKIVVSIGGRNWAVLLAFVAAILNFTFFSYAPFISHDIMPGLLFLAMIVLTNRYLRDPGFKLWFALVMLGAAAALIKHVFGIFWIAILVSSGVIFLFNKNIAIQQARRKWLYLLCGAVASGAVTWIVLASVLVGNTDYVDVHYLFRPYYQLKYLLSAAAGTTEFPWWVYIRNIQAYGLIAVIVLPAGIYIALMRGDLLNRLIVMCLVIVLVFMHALATKEIRYLAHLSPLVAVLLITPFKYILDRKIGKLIIVAGLLFSISPLSAYSLTNEAMRIFHPFYKSSPFTRGLSVVDKQSYDNIIINWRVLSFSSGLSSPLTGDPYHRIFHMAGHHLSGFLGFNEKIVRLPHDGIDRLVKWPERTVVISSNGAVLINKAEFLDIYSSNTINIKQYLSEPRSLVFHKKGTGSYLTDSGLMVSETTVDGVSGYYIAGHDLTEELLNGISVRLRLDHSDKVFWLRELDNDIYFIRGLDNESDLGRSGSFVVSWLEVMAIVY